MRQLQQGLEDATFSTYDASLEVLAAVTTVTKVAAIVAGQVEAAKLTGWLQSGMNQWRLKYRHACGKLGPLKSLMLIR